MQSEHRKVREVLAHGVIAGVIAGIAAGMIDAIWGWRAAGQFVQGTGHVRFVLFAAMLHGAAGAALGLWLAGALLTLSRASRLGDLLRFGWAEHVRRRTVKAEDAVAGLALALVMLPVVAIALFVAYRIAVPFLATRKVPRLVVAVAMTAAVAAVAAAIPVGFVLARGVETGLAWLVARVPRLRVLASPVAPLIATGVLLALAVIAWLARDWESARTLPLRRPLVIVLGLILVLPAWRPAQYLVIRSGELKPLVRRAAWVALPIVLVIGVLVTGGSASVIKAASAYTGLGAPITRSLRKLFDRDHDGYARFLGGGDCNDHDPTIHPGVPEIPDDGIDQNCVGGDASATPAPVDFAFVPVPPTVPPDFRVLLITIDTVRADHFSTYGYGRKTTPNIDAIGAAGTVFEQGWAHAPSTRYSMPAILTGRLPLDVHYDTSVEGWPGISLAATTIAEALQPLGFVGGGITNYWYFDKNRHMDQGMVEYDNEDARLHQGVSGVGPEETRGTSSKEQTDKAIAFVDRHTNDRWFLWVHYYDPHYGYEPHPGHTSFGTDRMALYDGEIAFTDEHIGRLVADLKAKGLYDKTVIVVTGDHGEGFGEHGVELHGYHLYEAQTKVPLIIRVPGLAPRRATTPAGHVDILPTLVNLAGGKPTPEMMGQSLVGEIAGTDQSRLVVQQLSYEGNHEMRAGTDGKCHVIYNVSPDTSWEVYRVDRDPTERIDVSGDSDECADARHKFEQWYDRAAVPAGATEALLAARPVIANPLDVDLGPSVRLLAVDVPPTARAGDSVSVTWTFEARAAVQRGWKVFAHLDGPNHTMVNGDHSPARPFEWWKPGQFIRYTTTLVLPRTTQAGTYTLDVGLFRGNVRAPATAPHSAIDHDAVAVATLEVVP